MMDRLGSLCKVGLEALHLINDDDDMLTGVFAHSACQTDTYNHKLVKLGI